MASLEETIKENFRYGITDMLILKLLTEEDKYVYQITRDLEEKSNGVFKVSKVSLYIPLNRMAQRHFVEEYKMPKESNPVLVDELIPKLLGLGEVQKVLQNYGNRTKLSQFYGKGIQSHLQEHSANSARRNLDFGWGVLIFKTELAVSTDAFKKIDRG